MKSARKPTTQSRTAEARATRLRDVLRIFEEEGWGGLELVHDWNGGDLEELRELLRPEEFETLLDRIRDLDDRD